MAGKLSAVKVKSAGKGKHGDGDGLWLYKSDKDHGKWILLFRMHGRRREMGLGPFPATTLAEAREQATHWRECVRRGVDPIQERERLDRVAKRNLHSFADVARDCFEAKKPELKGDGEAGRWFSPIRIHVIPKIGHRPIAELDQIDIRDMLAPIWHTKADAARKAMNRTKAIFEHGLALGLDVDLQAPAKAKVLLGKTRHEPTGIPSMPWAEVPAFYASLDEQTPTQLALRLLILTASRSRPIRFLREDHIDGDVWTIPAPLMKGLKGKTSDFRIPLSTEALAVLNLARPLARDGFLFPSVRKGVISDMSMAQLMKRRNLAARPHGFRSSLTAWVTEAQGETLEMRRSLLSHKIGDGVDQAYDRTDRLDPRRDLLERWGNFVAGRDEPSQAETDAARIAALEAELAELRGRTADTKAEHGSNVVRFARP